MDIVLTSPELLVPAQERAPVLQQVAQAVGTNTNTSTSTVPPLRWRR
jgi:hypothetical protein